MKNWKTTLSGLVAGLPVAAYALSQAYSTGAFTGKTGAALGVSIGLVLLGAYSKDHNVTGGTSPQ